MTAASDKSAPPAKGGRIPSPAVPHNLLLRWPGAGLGQPLRMAHVGE